MENEVIKRLFQSLDRQIINLLQREYHEEANMTPEYFSELVCKTQEQLMNMEELGSSYLLLVIPDTLISSEFQLRSAGFESAHDLNQFLFGKIKVKNIQSRYHGVRTPYVTHTNQVSNLLEKVALVTHYGDLIKSNTLN